MELQSIAPNRTILRLIDGTEVFFSYRTPVAGYIPGKGYVRTEKYYSLTTNRHIQKYLGERAAIVSQDEINALLGERQ